MSYCPRTRATALRCLAIVVVQHTAKTRRHLIVSRLVELATNGLSSVVTNARSKPLPHELFVEVAGPRTSMMIAPGKIWRRVSSRRACADARYFSRFSKNLLPPYRRHGAHDPS